MALIIQNLEDEINSATQIAEGVQPEKSKPSLINDYLQQNAGILSNLIDELPDLYDTYMYLLKKADAKVLTVLCGYHEEGGEDEDGALEITDYQTVTTQLEKLKAFHKKWMEEKKEEADEIKEKAKQNKKMAKQTEEEAKQNKKKTKQTEEEAKQTEQEAKQNKKKAKKTEEKKNKKRGRD